MGKGYCDQSIFILNILEIINQSCSRAYVIDSYDVCHGRLGHVNYSYVMKLRRLGLINMYDKQSNKYDICVKSKITKKACHSIERLTKLLGLIHTDLPYLKQTMFRGGKNYFVILVEDYSRNTKVYLIKHKVGAFMCF